MATKRRCGQAFHRADGEKPDAVPAMKRKAADAMGKGGSS